MSWHGGWALLWLSACLSACLPLAGQPAHAMLPCLVPSLCLLSPAPPLLLFPVSPLSPSSPGDSCASPTPARPATPLHGRATTFAPATTSELFAAGCWLWGRSHLSGQQGPQQRRRLSAGTAFCGLRWNARQFSAIRKGCFAPLACNPTPRPSLIPRRKHWFRVPTSYFQLPAHVCIPQLHSHTALSPAESTGSGCPPPTTPPLAC